MQAVVESLEDKIDDADIAAVVARRTGIPVTKMMTAEKDKLVNMEAFLSKKIIGQKDAIKVIANAIRKSRAGLKFFSPGPPCYSTLIRLLKKVHRITSARSAVSGLSLVRDPDQSVLPGSAWPLS